MLRTFANFLMRKISRYFWTKIHFITKSAVCGLQKTMNALSSYGNFNQRLNCM